MSHEKAACSISTTVFDAVIFDLDGVVTDTASVHAAAWKRMFDDFLSRHAASQGLSFLPFEIETDYIQYVDGKPRLDGLRSFLESRGIKLPEGTPEDPAGEDTIRALGEIKNKYFLDHIKEKGAKVYSSTVDLIRSLRKYGLKTAIISSSKSCRMILDSVNLLDSFDVKVDGMDSETLGIAGKPAPDIFLEAARQLKVKPERAVVIEDAVSGVQAGRAGKFGLVIGIARYGEKETLRDNGAHTVVEDLAEVCVLGDAETTEKLPSALKHFDKISRKVQGKTPAVFLDYDGTLTPIVETPDLAVMSEDMREAVIELAKHCPVGIISGRDLKDVQDKVGIDSVVYAGSHGFDITGPEGLQVGETVGEDFLPVLDKADKALHLSLGSISGLLLERKKFAIAIHYRLVDPSNVKRIEELVDSVVAENPKLRKSYGKKIFEIQPKMDWHKGKALIYLLKTLKLDRKDVLPFYIGDDVTDEDAFRALKVRGVGIVVRDLPYETAAAYSLKDPDEVRSFLLKLIPLCRSSL